MVDFTSDIVTAEKNELIRFSYLGTTESPAPVSYVWSFSDGTTSNDENPMKYFTTEGEKDISLTVYFDDASVETETKSAYIEITTAVEDEYKALQLTQFKNSTNFNKLISLIANRGTLLDKQAEYLTQVRKIVASNFSEVLNVIGEIVGLPRNNLSNAEYAENLLQMHVVNTSHGEIEAIIKYSELFVEPTTLIVYDMPGRIIVSLSGPDTINYLLFKQRLENIAAGGVRISLAVAAGGVGVPLEFEYTSEPAINPDSGLSEYGGSYTGGYLAELY